jgi:mannose-6-phosphate isomerase-like protein (cupin superfamily)
MEKVNEFEKEFRGGDSGVKYLFRGPNTEWGIILLLPGQKLGAHYHEAVEETFYFAEGGGTITVDDVPHKARPGDAFRLVAPERHDIVNDTGQPTKLIFIKCPYRPTDKISVEK